MRRFGRLMAAAGAGVVVVGVSAGAAAASPVTSGAPTMTATASAAHARAPVHGCPSAGVCLYSSKAVYRNDKPTVVDTDKTGVFVGGTFDTVAVNNTTATYSSEGYIEARIIHSFTLCEYVPDAHGRTVPRHYREPRRRRLCHRYRHRAHSQVGRLCHDPACQ